MLADVLTTLNVKIRHATVKHAQTIGTVERSHASLKRILKTRTNEKSNDWHRYVNMAVLAHNTTYNESTGYTPSQLFHGRVPFNALERRLNPQINNIDNPICRSFQKIDKKLAKMNETAKQNIIKNYVRYKAYYDRRAKAEPLREHEFVFLLTPEIQNQSERTKFNMMKWVGLYRVQKVLSDNNYIIRLVNSNKTQCVHRIRLRKYEPHEQIVDEHQSHDIYPDPDAIPESKAFTQLL